MGILGSGFGDFGVGIWGFGVGFWFGIWRFGGQDLGLDFGSGFGNLGVGIWGWGLGFGDLGLDFGSGFGDFGVGIWGFGVGTLGLDFDSGFGNLGVGIWGWDIGVGFWFEIWEFWGQDLWIWGQNIGTSQRHSGFSPPSSSPQLQGVHPALLPAADPAGQRRDAAPDEERLPEVRAALPAAHGGRGDADGGGRHVQIFGHPGAVGAAVRHRALRRPLLGRLQ